MRPALGLLFVALGVGCAVVGGRGPAVDGDGELRELRIPGGRGVLESVFDPRSGILFFLTTGPGPALLGTDTEWQPACATPGFHERIAPGPQRRLACFAFHSFEMLRIPDLQRLEEWPFVEDRRFGWGPSACLAWSGDGLVYAERRGQVTLLRPDPIRIERGGRSTLADVRAGAIDARTGRLVLCGDGAHVEVFDLERMVPVGVTALDGVETVTGVCAGGGWAWLATDEGAFVQLDVERCAAVRRTALAEGPGKVRVHVDLSPSGRLLAASATRFLGPHENATVLRVFRVGSGDPAPVAAARATLPWGVMDLTILEERAEVVLACQSPALVWRYG